jgi:hypothetical protein
MPRCIRLFLLSLEILLLGGCCDWPPGDPQPHFLGVMDDIPPPASAPPPPVPAQ